MEQVKYHSTGHWIGSLSVHRDDTYHKNPEFFVGKEVIITEKLDGGNVSLANGEVYARSNVEPSHAGWMAMVRKYHAWKTVGLTDLTFYGEDIAARHSLPYSVSRDQTYYVFAALGVDGVWRSWDDLTVLSHRYDLAMVPQLFRGKFNSTNEITKWFTGHLKEPSTYGVEREGFVMRIADAFRNEDFFESVCKFVRPNHVTTDQHWTKNWQWNSLT